MKYIVAISAAYMLVLVYGTFFALGNWSWIPLGLISVCVAEAYMTRRYVWVFTLILGFLMDAHFQFIGPYLLMNSISILILQWLHNMITPRRKLLSIAVKSGAVSVWYSFALSLVTGSSIGIGHTVFGSYPFNAGVLLALSVWAMTCGSLLTVHTLVTVGQYARR
jgi:hypothetical protein